MQGDLLPIVIGSIVGGLFGGILSIVILWVMSNKAQRTYPALSIPVPNGARYSPDFELWVQLNKYRRTEENCYTKGRGLLTSSTDRNRRSRQFPVCQAAFRHQRPGDVRQTRAPAQNQTNQQTAGTLAMPAHRIRQTVGRFALQPLNRPHRRPSEHIFQTACGIIAPE